MKKTIAIFRLFVGLSISQGALSMDQRNLKNVTMIGVGANDEVQVEAGMIDSKGRLYRPHWVAVDTNNPAALRNHTRAQMYLNHMDKWLKMKHPDKKPSQQFFDWCTTALEPRKGLSPQVHGLIQNLVAIANQPHRQ